MARCLSDNTLTALLCDQLSAEERAEIESHIDQCDVCRNLAGELAASCLHSSSKTEDVPDIADLIEFASWQPPARIEEYQLIRFVGRGQMGQVYEAHDTKLDRRVAIKFLRASEPDAESRERFRTEARAIARLKHSAVVAVYRAGDIQGHPYIVSEFVVGHSLDRVPKPISHKASLRIDLGIARGLAAAHQAGVVHRDIKPANVMLGADDEIKLLDFGLAKLADTLPLATLAEDDSTHPIDIQISLTRSGAWLGTPRYMAPEVWRGEPATAKSDLYSLGCVLYELCSGRPPFLETDIHSLRRAVLSQDPDPLLRAAPSIDRAFAGLVMRCLQRNPQQRPEDAQAVRGKLEQIQTGKHAALIKLKRALLSPVGIVALIGTLGSMIWIGSKSGIDQWTAMTGKTRIKAKIPRTVAILGFRNLNGKAETAWISTALFEIMRADLAIGHELRLIPAELLNQMKRDLELSDTENLTQESFRKIRNYYFDVDLVLVGAYALHGDRLERGLRLEYQMLDAATGATLVKAADFIDGSDLFTLVTKTTNRLRKQLRLSAVNTADYNTARTSIPTSISTARAYAEGLMALQELNLVKARERFEFAARENPQDPLIHRALAKLYFSLGYTEKQRATAQRAFALSGNLRHEEQIAIEAMYNFSIMNYTRSIELQKRLFQQHPDNLEYAIELCNILNEAERHRESLDTINRIMKNFPNIERRDPRIDLIASTSHYELGDYQASMAAVKRAADIARAHGASYYLAKAYAHEGIIHYLKGDYLQAEQAYNLVADQLKETEQHHDLAWALLGGANSKVRLGKLAAAASSYQTQAENLRRTGSFNLMVWVLIFHSRAVLEMGNLKHSAQLAEEALRIANEYHNRSGVFGAALQLGYINMALGNLPSAQMNISYAQSALSPPTEADLRERDARSTGMIHLLQGKFEFFVNNTLAAHRHWRDAIHDLGSVNDLYQISLTRSALAELLLELHDVENAEGLARLAATSFQQMRATDAECQSRALLARAFLAQRRKGEAKQQIAWLHDYAARSESARTRILAVLVEAQINASSQSIADLQAARVAMEVLREEVTRIGYVPERFMINLALAELMLKMGKRAPARKLLQLQADEAHALGFGLYERKARTLLRL